MHVLDVHKVVALSVALTGLLASLSLTACRARRASLELLRFRSDASSRGCQDLVLRPGDKLQVAVDGPAGVTGQILLRSDGEPTQFVAGFLFEGSEQLAPPEPFELPPESGKTVLVLVIEDEERARCTARSAP
ncbi:MAG: hypothetical protein AAF627_15145 [Myxococcota bacterium]